MRAVKQHPVIASVVGTLILVSTIVGGYAAYAATTATATCTGGAVTKTTTAQTFSVKCSVPLPAPVTKTVTVTATPTPVVTPSDTPAPTPSDTPTPTPSDTATPTPTPTDTATPAPAPAPAPSGAFPDASNTGVPAGTVLTKVPGQKTSGPGWTWVPQYEAIFVDGSGAVLDGLDVTGHIEIRDGANNVVIKNTRVTYAGPNWSIGIRNASGAVIRDSTLTGGGQISEVPIKSMSGQSITVLRNNISDWTTGVQLDGGEVRGNYIHLDAAVGNKATGQGYHINGIARGGEGTNLLTIADNTIINGADNPAQTDAIALFQDFGIERNAVVNHNYLKGGSFTIYGGSGSKGTSSNVHITNNVFAGGYSFGDACCFDGNGTDNVWSGNVSVDKSGTVAGTVAAPPHVG